MLFPEPYCQDKKQVELGLSNYTSIFANNVYIAGLETEVDELYIYVDKLKTVHFDLIKLSDVM